MAEECPGGAAICKECSVTAQTFPLVLVCSKCGKKIGRDDEFRRNSNGEIVCLNCHYASLDKE